ncbi:MAG TPA: MoaD family protein [Thermomicrobiales bacterium]|nr:MoaD family protein [Thermomicrobiales bacterium]
MSITITVRHFAVVREIVGVPSETRVLPEGSTPGDVLTELSVTYPRLSAVRKSAMVMVNHTYANFETVLRDGDELAFIPPVSGGAGTRLMRVTSDKIDPREAEDAVRDPSCGAVITFTGEVRDVARGSAVTALDYEAYAEAAEVMMHKIADEIAAQTGVDRIAIVHRTGLLQPGEASVIIAVASPHRAEAFEASRMAIERLKQLVPIWKKEHYSDGSAWIGSEADYQKALGRE